MSLLCVIYSYFSGEVNIQMFVLAILSREGVITEDPGATAIITHKVPITQDLED